MPCASAQACRGTPSATARCAELARFLVDPEVSTWVLRAAEPGRSHVEQTIKQARCDLDMRTDKQGRPYSLVCIKNQVSYERRTKQRKQDLDDLAWLASCRAIRWLCVLLIDMRKVRSARSRSGMCAALKHNALAFRRDRAKLRT